MLSACTFCVKERIDPCHRCFVASGSNRCECRMFCGCLPTSKHFTSVTFPNKHPIARHSMRNCLMTSYNETQDVSSNAQRVDPSCDEGRTRFSDKLFFHTCPGKSSSFACKWIKRLSTATIFWLFVISNSQSDNYNHHEMRPDFPENSKIETADWSPRQRFSPREHRRCLHTSW